MKKYLFNFAQEGASLILVTMLLSVASLILYNQFQYDVFLTSFYIQFFYFLVCCFFFRDPIREIKTPNQDKFLSPADGTILSVKDIEEGRNAGCGLVIGVLSGADNEEKLMNAGADIVVDKIIG